MKISVIGSSDTSGGAARSAYRLHRALLDISISSNFFTLEKKGDDSTVMKGNSYTERFVNLLRPYADMILLKLYRKRMKGVTFSPALVPTSRWVKKNAFKADILNLHWVGAGFISIESISKISRPIVWTLHDSWVFTGGCHVPHDCTHYVKDCGKCPQLGSQQAFDLSYITHKRKQHFWNSKNITLVTPSNWLAMCARKSSLFKNHRIEVIPNCIDTAKFKVLDKYECRKILNLPQDCKIVLFGAVGVNSDTNKGFQFIAPAIASLIKKTESKKIKLIIFGASKPNLAPELGLETYYLGRLQDDVSLSVLYSAADVVLVPSMQENLPNVIMEAMACGTPAVAFNVGGISDLVDHKVNGFLASPFNPEDLAGGVSWVLDQQEKGRELSIACRDKVVQNFDAKKIAHRYEELFKDLLKTGSSFRVK